MTEMQVIRVSVDTESFFEKNSKLWRQAKAHVFNLSPTPLSMQPSPWIKGAFSGQEWGKIGKATLRMLHNGDSIAALLQWQVKQPATSTRGADEFCDACTIMFPFVKDAPITMGSDHEWVNMWLWRADDFGPFSITAAGIGTSERLKDHTLRARGHFTDGSWRVTFVRTMDPRQSREHVPLKPGMQWQVAVGLWEGSNQERAGLKSFSPSWTSLDIAS